MFHPARVTPSVRDVEELRSHVRTAPPPDDDVLVVRGGDDSVEKLRHHAQRTHRADVLDGMPVYGLSVYCALDELDQRRLYRQLASYRMLRTSVVGRLRAGGFPTATDIHSTAFLPWCFRCGSGAAARGRRRRRRSSSRWAEHMARGRRQVRGRFTT